VLSRTPPGIEFGNLDSSHRQFRKRPDPSCANSELHQADDVVKTVKRNGGEYVRDDDGLVITCLICGNVNATLEIQKEGTNCEEENRETSNMCIKE